MINTLIWPTYHLIIGRVKCFTNIINRMNSLRKSPKVFLKPGLWLTLHFDDFPHHECLSHAYHAPVGRLDTPEIQDTFLGHQRILKNPKMIQVTLIEFQFENSQDLDPTESINLLRILNNPENPHKTFPEICKPWTRNVSVYIMVQ